MDEVYRSKIAAAQPTLFADEPRATTQPPEPPYRRGIKAAAADCRIDPNGPLSRPAAKLLFTRSWVTRQEACVFGGLTRGALDILVREGHVRLFPTEGLYATYYRRDIDDAITAGLAGEAEQIGGALRGAA